MAEDEPTSALQIYTGATPNFRSNGRAKVRTIFHPEGKVLCNRDIALVPDIKPATVRFHTVTLPGERIRAVGYGQDESYGLGARRRKTGVPILAVGPAPNQTSLPLGNQEFEVGMSICQGDSGGPAFSETSGTLIGVVPRGTSCSDDFGHVYTLTAGFEDLFARALSDAELDMMTGMDDDGEHADGGVSAREDGGEDESSSGQLLNGSDPSARTDVGSGNSAGETRPGAACGAWFAERTSSCVARKTSPGRGAVKHPKSTGARSIFTVGCDGLRRGG